MAAAAKTCFQPHTCQQMALAGPTLASQIDIPESALQFIYEFSVRVSKNSSRKQVGHQAPLESHYYNAT